MFSWICPQCGREVSPSYTECPDCAAKGKVPTSPAAEPSQPPPNLPPGTEPGPPPPYYTQAPPYPPPPPGPAGQPPQYQPYPPQYAPPQYPPQYAPLQGQYPQYPPPPQQYQPPPQQYQPPPPQYQPPPQYAPPAPSGRRLGGLPTWLLTPIFALAFVGVVWGVYWLVGSNRGSSQAAAPPANVENPAAKAGAKASPLQKYIEISGLRFLEDTKKKPAVKFIITNHSDADASGLAGNVTIWARTQKSEEDPVGTFAFTANVPPQASQEVTAPLTTKLKMYELPDWQNVNTDIQITAPQ